MKFPTRFANLFELSRLPWFGLRDGRLVLTDRTVGPTIDCHSHLALSYVLPNRVALDTLHPSTQTYLPADRALDLDVYVNCNLLPEDLARLTKDLTIKSIRSQSLH